jgi:hypothetical protein
LFPFFFSFRVGFAVWGLASMPFFDATMAVRVTFVKRNKSNQKCWLVVRWWIALRVPAAFFYLPLILAPSVGPRQTSMPL